MSELTRVLENFCRLEGVRCAMLLNAQGDLVDSHVERQADPDTVSHLAARCLALGRMVAAKLHKETVNFSYVEFRDCSLIAEVLDSRSALVIATDPNANLGRLRLEIRKNRKTVDGLIG